MARRSFFFWSLLYVFCVTFVAFASAPAHANSKYAALVIDADRGSVLYAANANDARYPASLTKMMTLYLTFEALERKKITLNSRIRVSKKAAGMPQTNIGLKAGEGIRVRDIIRSLVVRSANDSAVVIAEHLGGSEREFARLMTAKARALGMKNTVFRNASGLPDKAQRTTARDLAVLALALKKHYPQYFHFFQTMVFSYKGKTYKTHNNVMQRYPGADGIKTGYIRASGFNLATSARRNGQNVIAIVMGGKTSRSRDDHMISLLDRSFAKLQKANKYAAERGIPMPEAKPGYTDVVHVASLEPSAGVASLPVPSMKPERVGAAASSQNSASRSKVITLSNRLPLPVRKVKAAKGQFRPSAQSSAIYKDWGIQVGAFDKKHAAINAVKQARNIAEDELSNSRAAVSDVPGKRVGEVVYRARLANLTEGQARNACRALLAGDSSCFVFQVTNARDL